MLERRLALEAAPAHTPTIGVISTFLGLAWITLLLRYYTRLVLVKKVYSEDWVMAITMVLFTGYCASAIALSSLVTQGAHKVLSIDDSLNATKLVLIVESFYIWTVMTLKISVGIFYLRISLDRRLTICSWACMIVSVLMGTVLFLITVLECGAFANILIYVTKKLSGQCLPSTAVASVSYVHASVTCLTDFIFVVMPIFILWKVNMPTREKITAGGLLMLASTSGIAAAVRFLYIGGISAPTETFFATCTGVTIWSCIEPAIGILAGSIVCLRPFLRAHLSPLSHLLLSLNAKEHGLGSTTPNAMELGRDTSALTRDAASPNLRDAKTWFDDRVTRLSDPTTVKKLGVLPDARTSSEASVEIFDDPEQGPVRGENDGLPLGVFVTDRLNDARVSRGSHL